VSGFIKAHARRRRPLHLTRPPFEYVWAVASADIIRGGMAPQAAADEVFKRVAEIFAKHAIAQS
jgi:hypothetical protein